MIPSWSKDAGAAKPTFKPDGFGACVGTRHCLVLANGFYEWRKDGKQRFPLHFKLKSGASFTFPGLGHTWRKPDGTTLHRFTLLTTTANELVRPVHDRMLVILDTDAALQWLACTPETAAHCLDLLDLLKPFPAEHMTAYEVSQLVNNGKIDSPECVKPI